MSAERLQKVLASAGIASRRDCEELIVAGKIAVNGKVVRVLGSRVDLDIDTITVDGKPLEPVVQRTYIMLHKPTSVISTAEDTHDRPTVVNMVDVPARVFPVGRLDQDSEGLLLLTDDGELTQRLTHPSYEVEKEYHVLLDEPPTSDALREWREGVNIEGRRTAPAWVQTHKQTDEGTWIRIVLHEGRKRQIRMMVRSLDYAVLRLIRVREGPLSLGELGSGEWRHLTDDEVKALWEHAGQRRFDPAKEDEYKPAYSSAAASTQPSSRGTSAPPERERQYRQTDERRDKPSTSRTHPRGDDAPRRDRSSDDRRERPPRRSESGEQANTRRTHRRSDTTDNRGGERRRSYKSSDDRRERPPRRSESGERTATSTPREQSNTQDDRRRDKKSRGADQRRREGGDTKRNSTRRPARSTEESQRPQKGPQSQRSGKRGAAGKPTRGATNVQRQKPGQRTDRPFRPKGRRKSDT